MLSVPCWSDREFMFEPAHTALLVIDMQRDFLAVDSPFAEESGNATIRSAMPAAMAVVAAARKTGLGVVHTREGYAADHSDVSAAKAEMGYVGVPGPYGPVLIRGSRGHDFMDGFEPAPNEPVIDKASFSAFYNTPLDGILDQRGVTHLILIGVTTECCVHSTQRDAVERGFLCLTVEDACAAGRRSWHDATMEIVQAESNLFGWITSSHALTSALHAGTPQPSAATTPQSGEPASAS